MLGGVLAKTTVYVVFETGPESSHPVSDIYEDEEQAIAVMDQYAEHQNEIDREVYQNQPPTLGYYKKVGDKYEKLLYTLHIKQQTLHKK